MSNYEQITLASRAHSDAGVLTVLLYHISLCVQRDEDCVTRYARALQLYAEIGQRLAALAEIVQPIGAAIQPEEVDHVMDNC